MSVNITAPEALCKPGDGVLEGCSLSDRLFDTTYLTQHVLKWEALIYIAVVLFFLYAARWTYTLKLWLLHGRRLNFAFRTGFGQYLTTDDNKAFACSFAGYVLATGLILWSSVSDLGNSTGVNVLYILEWQAIGVLYLEVARLVNDKLLLSTRNIRSEGVSEAGFDNNVEMLKFGNVAVGAAEAGSYIASGLVSMASIAGPPGVWWQDLVASSAMFVLGQIVFVLFGHLINTTCVTRFSFFAEIKKRNAAAGVLFALELIAIGNLVANSILKSDSLVTFGVWLVLGTFILLSLRFLIDLVILPHASLNKEIQADRNIGAALLVGGISVGLSFILNTFLPDTCRNDT